MKKIIVTFFFQVVFIQSFFLQRVLADDVRPLDGHSQKALGQTQDLLVSPEARKKAIGEDKSGESQTVDNSVQALTGSPEVSQDVYKLASEVFAQVVKEANGDPAKMKEAIDRYQRDPASFAKTWTPEQKAKLQELSEKVNKPAVNPK